MTEVDYLQNLMDVVSHEESNAERRAGKVGPWCFSCGHESNDLSPCGCSFPEAFRCARLRTLCADCRKAHDAVSKHLEMLFAAKRLAVHRADSRRSRFFRFLRDALETLGEKGDRQAKTLRSLLGGHADPRADEEAEFRSTVLDCFSRSHFSDFRGLADAIAEQEQLFYVSKIASLPSEFWKQCGL